MINFYKRFIPDAANHQAILHELHKSQKKNDKGPLVWSKETRNAFKQCHDDLANATLLIHRLSNAPMSLTVDASDSAMGAVVEQFQNGMWKPLSFFLANLLQLKPNIVPMAENSFRFNQRSSIFVLCWKANYLKFLRTTNR